VEGDVALTRQMTQAEVEAVSGFGRTAFGLKWYRRRGLCHAREGDAWWEYGGKTAEVPDAKVRAARRWEGHANR